MDSEHSQFLKDLGVEPQNDVLDQELLPPETELKESDEEQEQKAKNRRERRLVEQNQRLREEAIDLTARLQTIKESQTIRETTEEADYLKRAEKIYGNATPEGVEATRLLKEALQGVRESAKDEILKELESREQNESQALRKEEQTIDSILESVEDDYGIGSDDRKGFLSLLERVSPKDRDGNIIEYADPDATAELYLNRKEKVSSRAKDLASRSMTHSGGQVESKLVDDAQIRFLKENGIL